MDEVRLSIMDRGPEFNTRFRRVLDDFERIEALRVRLDILPWPNAWETLVKFGMYGDGPQVSEIGSTWIGDLVGMNTLSPFDLAELCTHDLGKNAFLAPAWAAATLAGSRDASLTSGTWGVPMTVDPRIIYYRIDHLAAAGIDPATAFSSACALADTLTRLQAAGVSAPWVVPTHRSRLTVHNLASWIWGAGGGFMTPDMKHTAFASPASRAGITEYFQLARYISAPHRELGDDDASQAFYRGECSVTIAGPWLHNILDSMPGKVGRSLPPGVPFVGGTHLVIWRRPGSQRPLLNLINYLTSPAIQLAIYHDSTVLPARPDVLAREPFANDPFYAAMASQLQTARSFPFFRLWGMLENRLTEAMTTIWRGVLEKTSDTSPESASSQKAAIASLVAETLEPLAHRLDITLSS